MVAVCTEDHNQALLSFGRDYCHSINVEAAG